PVGLEIVAREIEHRRQVLPIVTRDFNARFAIDRKKQREYLEHKPVIGNRAFVVHAIGEYLSLHLDQQMFGAETHPFAGLFQLGHRHTDHEETYEIREKVIARKPMIKLEVGADETAVRDEH